MEFTHKGDRVRTVLGEYRGGGTCLRLEYWDREFDSWQPFATASVALEGPPPAKHLVWIKTWAENAGPLQALVSAGIVRDTGERRTCGYLVDGAALVELDKEKV